MALSHPTLACRSCISVGYLLVYSDQLDLEASGDLASRVTARETIGPSVVGRVAFMIAAVGGKVVRSERKSVAIVCLVGEKGQRHRGKEQESLVTGMRRGDTKSRPEVRGHSQCPPPSNQ